MCSVYKTILYRNVKSYFSARIAEIKSKNETLESFLEEAMNFAQEFTLCSNQLHHKSNRMFNYYLTKFFKSEENSLDKKFFPRTKYYFGLSKRSEVNNISKYHLIVM